MAQVFEFVKREAARYGVLVESSEIVGLVPKRAMEDAAEWFLQVEKFDPSMILENRLAAVIAGKSAVGGLRSGVEPFIEQLAEPTAVPGGGSASAAAGAMAAGLAAMVAEMSRGKKAFAEFSAELGTAVAKLAVLREELKKAIDADAAAYQSVVTAYKAQKNAAPEQLHEASNAVAAALQEATLVPLRAAECAAEVSALIASLRAKTNPRMGSDLTVARALAGAAVEGALANVEINLESLDGAKESTFIAETRARVAELRIKQDESSVKIN
jgi:glutamate formiminotransferase/formiminotetrahydrofolate cyclodeaminase